MCVCVEAPSSAPNTNTRCAKPPNQQRQSTAPLKAIINDNRLHDCPIIQFVTSQPSGFLHTAPPYLASSFTRVADMPHRRRLRSASTEQLDVPTCRRSTVGGRAFPVAGAKVLNGLEYRRWQLSAGVCCRHASVCPSVTNWYCITTTGQFERLWRAGFLSPIHRAIRKF